MFYKGNTDLYHIWATYSEHIISVISFTREIQTRNRHGVQTHNRNIFHSVIQSKTMHVTYVLDKRKTQCLFTELQQTSDKHGKQS
jgi:hypothetical protein